MTTETHVNVAGSWEKADEVHTRVSGAWRRCPLVYTRVSGAWKLVHSDLKASVDTQNAFASLGQTQTNAVTVTAERGAEGYSYAWSRVSGSDVPQPNNPTGATTGWSAPDSGPYSAVWRCTVTDAYGAQATVDISVEFIGDN